MLILVTLIMTEMLRLALTELKTEMLIMVTLITAEIMIEIMTKIMTEIQL